MPPRKKQVVVEQTEDVKEESTVPAQKPKTTRQKKSAKHQVVAVVTPDGIQGNFSSDTKRPLIAHLPIHSSDIVFHNDPFRYDPNPPTTFEAYDISQVDPFSTEATYENVPQEELAKNEIVETSETQEFSSYSAAQQPQKITQTPQTTMQTQQQTSRKEYGPTKLLVAYAGMRSSHTLPDNSPVACFWCCEHFQGRPCVIPIQTVEDV